MCNVNTVSLVLKQEKFKSENIQIWFALSLEDGTVLNVCVWESVEYIHSDWRVLHLCYPECSETVLFLISQPMVVWPLICNVEQQQSANA